MPEGDTLHRIERALAPLVGHEVDFLSLPRRGLGASVVGDTVVGVEALGKHLLISFSGGLVLHTHLKMTGVWHRYGRGEAWRRARETAVAIVGAGPFESVCFHAPVARLVDRRRIARELSVPLHGRDVLRDDLDLDVVVRALRALPPSTPLGVALLQQRAVAGIGNVYVSELCFRARLSPARPIGDVDDERLRALISDAASVMRRNVDVHSRGEGSPAVAHYRYQRTTTTGCERGKGPIAVYGRAEKPCTVCGTPIVMFRQGPALRSTYACPRCQDVVAHERRPTPSKTAAGFAPAAEHRGSPRMTQDLHRRRISGLRASASGLAHALPAGAPCAHACQLGLGLVVVVMLGAACSGAQRRTTRFERATGSTPTPTTTTTPSDHSAPVSPTSPPLIVRNEDRMIEFTVRGKPAGLRATAMWSTIGDDVVAGPVFVIVPGAGDVSRRGIRRRNGVDTYLEPIAVTTAWQELIAASGASSLAWDKRTCGPNDDVDCLKNPQDDIDDEGPVAMAKDVDAACALAPTIPGFDGRIVLFAHGQGAQVALSSSCAVRAAAIVLVNPPPREIDAVLVDATLARLQRLTQASPGRLTAEQAMAATELKNLAASTSARFASMRAGKFSREARVDGATIAFWLGWMSLTQQTPALVAAVKDKTVVVLGSRDSQLSDEDAALAKALPAHATLVFDADHHLLVDGALRAEVGLAVIDAVAALLGPSPS